MARKLTEITADLVNATRFWSKVDCVSTDPEKCWVWCGAKNPAGYGIIELKTAAGRRPLLAHRVAYTLSLGPIPCGLFVLHSCNNPACCNPAHLRPGTAAENSADTARSGAYERPLKRGQTHPASKFTIDEINTAKTMLYGDKMSQKEIAKMLGCSRQTVARWRGRRGRPSRRLTTEQASEIRQVLSSAPRGQKL